jgi:hypothetical protein
MSFDFRLAFFPRPLQLLEQAMLEWWESASTPAKFHRNANAISEQMRLENSCHLLRSNSKMYGRQNTKVQSKGLK